MKIENLYKLLVGLNLFGFPLLMGVLAPLSIESTPFSIALRTTILLSSLWLIFKLLIDKKIETTGGIFWLPLLVFWIFYIARIYVDTLINPSYALSREVSDYWIWAVGACFLPMLALLTKPKANYLMGLDKVCFVFVFIACLLTFLLSSTEYIQGDQVVDIGRLNLVSLNPISIGHLGGTLVILSFWLFFKIDFSRLIFKLTFMLASIIGIYLMLGSGSRGPFVAVSFSLLIFMIFSKKHNYIGLIVFGLIAIAVLYKLALYLDTSGAFPILNRIESTLSGNDYSVIGRQESYSGAFYQFVENPLFGDSLEEKTTGYYPHNVILEAFMSTGIVGGLAFLAFFLYVFYYGYMLIKTDAATSWIALIFMQYFIGAQFSGAIYTSTTMWIFSALCLTAIKHPVQK